MSLGTFLQRKLSSPKRGSACAPQLLENPCRRLIFLHSPIGAHKTIRAMAMLQSAIGLAFRQSAPASRFFGNVGRRNPASCFTLKVCTFYNERGCLIPTMWPSHGVRVTGLEDQIRSNHMRHHHALRVRDPTFFSLTGP
jgi:hypothetical protein